MGRNSYFPSGNASVTGGDGAFGSWTTVFTAPVALCGFYLSVGAGATGPYGVFNLFIGDGTPGTPDVEYGVFDGGFAGMVYFPLPVLPNTEIQVQTWNMNSSTDAVTVYVIGVPSGVRESRSSCQVLGTSTSSNFTSLATTPTSLGTSLALPAKEVCIVGGNSSSDSFTGSLTLSIGSSGATNLLENVGFGCAISDYISSAYSFPLFIPPSQDIWLTTSATPARGTVYLFY